MRAISRRGSPSQASPAEAGTPAGAARWRRVAKLLVVTAVTIVLLLAALLGVFGIIVGRVPEYRVQVQDWLSERTGVVIEFRSLSARLRLFGPELIFEDAVVRTPDRTQVLATAERGSVAFDLWNSLRNRQLSAGRFSLSSPEIGLIRTRERRIQLLGQSALPERTSAKPIAIEQLPTGQFRVRNARVTFTDEVTGRGPWSMSGISFDLTRDIDSIRLQGDARLPDSLGGALRFAATATGVLKDPHAVVSTFSIAGEDLDLAGWADVFPDEWPVPETGHGLLELAGSLRGAELTELSARVDFARVSAVLPLWVTPLPGPEPMPVHEDDRAQPYVPPVVSTARMSAEPQSDPQLPAQSAEPTTEIVSYERIAFQARAQRDGQDWHVSIADLDLSRAGSPWQSARIEGTWSRTEAAQRGRLAVDRLVLGNIWPLLAYLPESPFLAKLRALRARGVLENIAVTFERAADATPAYTIEAKLADVGFDPVARIPGVTGISGTLRADHTQGELHVVGREVTFELPRMFRHVLTAATLDGDVSWNVDAERIEVHSDNLQVAGEDGRANAVLTVRVPRDGGMPVLEIAARSEDLNLAATGKYVPGHKLSKKTLAWFDNAFVDGRIKSASFEMNGPVRLFPFRNDEGTFTARAEVENATLLYHDAWLPLTDVAGEVSFHNQSMNVRVDTGRVGGLTTNGATAEIKDLKDVELRVRAATQGTLTDAFSFLLASPLASTMLGEQLAKLEGEGAVTADVRLFLPIKRMERRDVQVNAKIANATLKHGDIEAPVRALSGSLSVHNSLLTRAELHGRWLSGPVAVEAMRLDARSSELVAHGRADAAWLKTLLDVPASIDIDGEAAWRLTTKLTARADDEAQEDRRFQLTADLRDFALGLPAPLGKRLGEPRQLDLVISLEPRNRAVVRGALGDVRALLSFRRDDGGWILDRGGVRADGQPAAVPSHRGLRIEGSIERFVLDDWLALKGPERRNNKRRLIDYLQAANVRVGSFELFGYRWSDLRGVLQATTNGWRIDVDGPEAVGQVFLPESFTGSMPLRATMERLVLAKGPRERNDGSSGAQTIDPRQVPALEVHVDDMHMDGRKLGTVDLTATRVASGLNLERLKISSGALEAEGWGEWLMSPQGPRSRLTLTARSSDVAATLVALDYTPFMEAQRGELRAQLNWAGGFDGRLLERASGTISVRAENGQIVNLQPGAGRMLGLFSVAALPRRLALDFSDLTDKGLAFDTIQGDFDVLEGNAYTSNLLLRGPAAEIGIAGRTGFGARDYDQTAVVTGNLGASLPVAGAIAGGPAVGAALLLFSQVFKEPLKGMTRGYYRITGPWDNPNVERVDASAAKDASARVSGASE